METTNRRYDLDWLRVIAFYILIFYHVGMIFVPWEFHIKNPTTAEWFETWMAFLSQWRLPLLFTISGAVVFHSLGKRSGKIFMKERFVRLFIPLLFGMFIIVPPQIYFERILNGAHYENYFHFWLTVFNFVPYPLGGSVSWHHLWYVLYILVYSVLALPLFLYLRSERSANFKNKFSNLLKRKPNLIYFVSILFLIDYYALAPIFPTTHGLVDDWYNHATSLSFFMLGFFISSIEGASELLAAKRKQSLIMSAIPASILILFVWGPTFEFFNEDAEWFFFLYGALKWMFIPSFLFTVFGYAKIILNRSSRLLSYANESVYPLYILHQTVEIAFGYYVIQLELPLMVKFALLVILTFGVSFLLYEFAVKRVNLLRLFFGMKLNENIFSFKKEYLNAKQIFNQQSGVNKMKTTILFFAAFIVIGTQCFAQEKAEQQTLISEGVKQSHHIKPGIYFVPVQNQTSAMIGISSGTVYDESIFVGIASFANLTHTRVNSGFAAVQLEQLFSTEKLIHFGYNLMAGIGTVKDYEKKTNLFDNFFNIFGTHYYFAQPGFTVELNFTNSIQVNLGAGYRFATGLNESNLHIAKSKLKNEDLNGFSFFLTLKLLEE